MFFYVLASVRAAVSSLVWGWDKRCKVKYLCQFEKKKKMKGTPSERQGF